DAAELFLSLQREGEPLLEAIPEEFVASEADSGDPPLPAGRETRLLLAPGSAPGQRFLALVQRALPEVKAVAAGSAEEIVFYREQRDLSLAELEQMGLVAPASYARLCAQQGYAPHARIDVTWRAFVTSLTPNLRGRPEDS